MTFTKVQPTAKEMLIAVICLVLVSGGAFWAASLTQGTDIFRLVLSPPDNTPPNIFQEAQRLDLHRTFFTAWAALILVTPALCAFLFRRSSESAARYWLAFWTVSFIAFLVHFYWAVFVMFGGDWNRILQAKGRVSAPVLDTIVTVWWGLDVLLAWLIKPERLLIRMERVLIHLLVFALFFLGSAKEGERTLSKILGIAMALAVLTSFVTWLIRWLKKSKRGDAPAVVGDLDKPVELSGDEKALLVERKIACPFIGSAVAQGNLPVRNDAKNPVASIEEVRKLGNTGGGDLGDLLVLFASGNHALMRGDSGKLNKPVPGGLFSLEFPGSQGSHPGHSGILQGDPNMLDSGRLSKADFARLTSRAKDGWIKRSDVGRFIAENLLRDPHSKVFGLKTVTLLACDLGEFVKSGGSALITKFRSSYDDTDAAYRDIEEKLTKLTGEDNLVGSAGEFGLLFAFLANRPGAREVEEVEGEPAVAVQDLEDMFVNKRLPEGWESWKKSRRDWIRNTTGLMISAGEQYHLLKRT